MNKEIGNVAGVSIMVSPEAYEDIKKRKTIYENEILSELQQRIEKAIEYIESRARKAGVKLMPREKELLSILRGENNDSTR